MSSGFTFSRFSVFTVERPSLDQFILLSLMLHVLVILLFGDTSGGGARRGEKLWGALTVTVQSVLPDRGVGLKLDRGATLLERPTRETRPVPVSPGLPSRNRDAPRSPPTDTPQPEEELAPPAQAPAFEMPAVISTDVEKAVTEFVVPKPSTDRVYSPPAPAADQAPRTAPVVSPPQVPPPVLVAPAMLPVAPPPIDHVIVPAVPVVAPLVTKPREETVIAPAPALRPEPPRSTIESEAAKPEREIVQPIAPSAEPKSREIPAPAPVAPPAPSEPPARAEASTPPKIEREAAKPTPPPAAAVSAPAAAPITPRAQSGTPSGTPGADRDLLKPRVDATTPSTDSLAPALGKAPGLDLDAIRRRAREINGSGTGPRTVFPFPGTPPQKPKSKEQQAFDKALKKNDCRDAYADMGLAAVVPLVLSAVREDGCKW